MSDRLVSVAVPVPALGLLTYRVPPDQPMPTPGARVIVPLGARKLTGVTVGHVSAADTKFALKDIIQVLDDRAFVPAEVVRLTEWVSEYYLAGPGATLAAALPPHGLTSKVDRFKTVRTAALTAAGIDAVERLAAHPRCAGDDPAPGACPEPRSAWCRTRRRRRLRLPAPAGCRPRGETGPFARAADIERAFELQGI